jgi:hypothetical protein
MMRLRDSFQQAHLGALCLLLITSSSLPTSPGVNIKIPAVSKSTREAQNATEIKACQVFWFFVKTLFFFFRKETGLNFFKQMLYFSVVMILKGN